MLDPKIYTFLIVLKNNKTIFNSLIHTWDHDTPKYHVTFFQVISKKFLLIYFKFWKEKTGNF